MRRLHDPEEVADLVAATFVAVIGSAASFDPRRGEPVPRLLGIAFNTLMSQRRGRRGEEQAWQRLSGRRLLDPDDYSRLEERIDSERLSGPLARAMEALPDGERELLTLVGHDGLCAHPVSYGDTRRARRLPMRSPVRVWCCMTTPDAHSLARPSETAGRRPARCL